MKIAVLSFMYVANPVANIRRAVLIHTCVATGKVAIRLKWLKWMKAMPTTMRAPKRRMRGLTMPRWTSCAGSGTVGERSFEPGWLQEITAAIRIKESELRILYFLSKVGWV